MWTEFNVLSLIMKKVLLVLLSEEWWNKRRHLSCMRALYCLYLLPLQSCHHSAPWGHASASLWHHSTLWHHHKTVWLEGNTSGQRSSFIHKNKNFLTRNNQHGGQRGRGQGLSGGGEVEPWLEIRKVGGDSVFLSWWRFWTIKSSVHQKHQVETTSLPVTCWSETCWLVLSEAKIRLCCEGNEGWGREEDPQGSF